MTQRERERGVGEPSVRQGCAGMSETECEKYEESGRDRLRQKGEVDSEWCQTDCSGSVWSDEGGYDLIG